MESINYKAIFMPKLSLKSLHDSAELFWLYISQRVKQIDEVKKK